MCELWYAVGNYSCYHTHIMRMRKKYKTNLYGQKLP
jgi:hypothetical protein